jgi:predicted HD superfamily hydrolase involved in NAD metabolism
MKINNIDVNEWIKCKLESDEERYLHSLGAEEAARELARRFGADEEKAALAALIHDNAKCYPYKELVETVKQKGFVISEEILNNHKILHAYAGAYLVREELSIEDAEIFDAITYHTTGRVGMSLFEKIVYLADKIENKTRTLGYRNKIIKKLEETNDIDEAILLTLEITIKSLIDRKLIINGETIAFWNYLLNKNLQTIIN